MNPLIYDLRTPQCTVYTYALIIIVIMMMKGHTLKGQEIKQNNENIIHLVSCDFFIMDNKKRHERNDRYKNAKSGK